MTPQPLICVSDVEASSRWYQRLLGCRMAKGPVGPAESSPGRQPGVNRPTSTKPREGRKRSSLPPPLEQKLSVNPTLSWHYPPYVFLEH